MKERPILFSGSMVRALLSGSKTQTRRAMKPQPAKNGQWTEWSRKGVLITDQNSAWNPFHTRFPLALANPGLGYLCPYGQPSERMWVRETFAIENTHDYEGDPGIVPPLGPVKWADEVGEANYRLIPRYRASEPDTQLMIAPSDKDDIGMRWKPSIHMPRWASRITLEITNVRVQRLQDISEADALAEGIVRQPDEGYGLADTTHYHSADPRISYWSLWDAINGPGSVEANPWVWAVSFRPLSPGEHGRASP